MVVPNGADSTMDKNLYPDAFVNSANMKWMQVDHAAQTTGEGRSMGYSNGSGSGTNYWLANGGVTSIVPANLFAVIPQQTGSASEATEVSFR